MYIVTGSNTGVGKELAQILYSKNAKVYIAARSEDKANAAIASIKAAAPDSTGSLTFLHLDLADLSTIKASASAFLSQEQKLHVLFNNAGVMAPPQGSKTAQGYELQLGTNNLGTFLFTKLLTPALLATAAAGEPPDSVRIVWVSSSAAESFGEWDQGNLRLDNLDYHVDKSPWYKYGISKVGNYYHAAEFMRRHADDAVVSVALNPGNLTTDLTRNLWWVQKVILKVFLTYPPVFGAYTELFAGLSPEVTAEKLKKHDWSEFFCFS